MIHLDEGISIFSMSEYPAAVFSNIRRGVRSEYQDQQDHHQQYKEIYGADIPQERKHRHVRNHPGQRFNYGKHRYQPHQSRPHHKPNSEKHGKQYFQQHIGRQHDRHFEKHVGNEIREGQHYRHQNKQWQQSGNGFKSQQQTLPDKPKKEELVQRAQQYLQKRREKKEQLKFGQNAFQQTEIKPLMGPVQSQFEQPREQDHNIQGQRPQVYNYDHGKHMHQPNQIQFGNLEQQQFKKKSQVFNYDHGSASRQQQWHQKIHGHQQFQQQQQNQIHRGNQGQQFQQHHATQQYEGQSQDTQQKSEPVPNQPATLHVGRRPFGLKEPIPHQEQEEVAVVSQSGQPLPWILAKVKKSELDAVSTVVEHFLLGVVDPVKSMNSFTVITKRKSRLDSCRPATIHKFAFECYISGRYYQPGGGDTEIKAKNAASENALLAVLELKEQDGMSRLTEWRSNIIYYRKLLEAKKRNEKIPVTDQPGSSSPWSLAKTIMAEMPALVRHIETATEDEIKNIKTFTKHPWQILEEFGASKKIAVECNPTFTSVTGVVTWEGKVLIGGDEVATGKGSSYKQARRMGAEEAIRAFCPELQNKMLEQTLAVEAAVEKRRVMDMLQSGRYLKSSEKAQEFKEAYEKLTPAVVPSIVIPGKKTPEITHEPISLIKEASSKSIQSSLKEKQSAILCDLEKQFGSCSNLQCIYKHEKPQSTAMPLIGLSLITPPVSTISSPTKSTEPVDRSDAGNQPTKPMPTSSGSNTEPKKPSPSGSNTEPKKPSPSGSNTEPKKPSSIGSNTEPKEPSSSGSNTEPEKPSSSGSNTEPKKPSTAYRGVGALLQLLGQSKSSSKKQMKSSIPDDAEVIEISDDEEETQNKNSTHTGKPASNDRSKTAEGSNISDSFNYAGAKRQIVESCSYQPQNMDRNTDEVTICSTGETELKSSSESTDMQITSSSNIGKQTISCPSGEEPPAKLRKTGEGEEGQDLRCHRNV